MTITHARAILNFIVKHKKKGMLNEDLIWLLANEFNIEEEDDDKG